MSMGVKPTPCLSTLSINKEALWESKFDMLIEVMPTLCLNTLHINKDARTLGE
jgi:hypothetical protein